MPVSLPTLLALLLLLLLLGAPACSSAATDTLSPGAVLAGEVRLVSNNSKFTLGFFRAPDGTADSSSSPPPDRWYLGIWFTAVPDRTTVWVANGGNPIVPGATGGAPELRVSAEGDLVVVNQATKSQTWSVRSANSTSTNNATAVLMNSGNLVLLDATTNSSTLWQSFDHPTDTLLPTAKLGRDKLTGLNRRLVSRSTTATPSPGPYCYEADPTSPQLVMRLCDDASATATATYWSTGAWNGRFFANIPELSGAVPSFRLAFVDDAREEYLQYNVSDAAAVTRNFLDVTGQNKHQVWLGAERGWLMLFASPKSQCDVYAACGPFGVCGYDAQPTCGCFKGFSVKSPADWDLGDQRGGCVRDAPLDCTCTSSSSSSSNGSRAVTSSTDWFFSVPNTGLPDGPQRIQNATSSGDCSTACLNNCSCSAYSYSASQGCLVWQDGLLNAKQPPTNSSGGTLHLRLSAKEMQGSSGSSNNSKRGVIIGAVTGASAVALGLVVLATALIIRRKKARNMKAGVGGGLVAFTYRELRSATKNFSDKLGQGGFGSVFKGQLHDATAIAVKRLDGSFQGDKQFRAEVSSIGVVQHVNLVKLVGFCCDGDSRFLVYEHVPNRSLDIHLFQTGAGAVVLDWAARYRIAVGVARGLAYLHEGCRERIIHCDVKPQNVLLDAALRPKLADFGMAKFVGRGFSRVLTTMRGTKGYLAPEWIGGAAVTPKVDVYSYGMVLLELVSGRRNSDEEYTASDGEHVVYFPMRAARELRKGDVSALLDERLRGDANLEEVERACKVACWCIQDDEDDRPTMGEVVQMLEGLLDRDMPPLPRLLESIFGRPQSLIP